MSQLGSIQRKTRSILADLKRARSAWAELNSDGLAVANALVNARLQERWEGQIERKREFGSD